MKGVQKRQPKFLSKEPLGQDLFGEKSQETLANIIVKQIKGADPNHKMIGIEGCWGSGKSNLLKLVENKFKENNEGVFHVFFYDVWGHQEDLQRKSILEELITFLENKISKISEVDGMVKELTGTTREITTVSVPKLSVGICLTFVLFFLFPIFEKFSDIVEEFYIKILIILLPIIILFVYFIIELVYIASKKDRRLPEMGVFATALHKVISVYKDKQIEVTETEFIHESSPTASEFQNFMEKISEFLTKKNQTLVIVFDNMDRLPEEKLRDLWSSLHIFFSDKQYNNIFTVVTFDRVHIRNAFKSEINGNENIGDDFIDKTFGVIYRVPLPSHLDWKLFFKRMWKNAFDDLVPEEEIQRVIQIYNVLKSGSDLTPRQIIVFINEIVLLKLAFPYQIPERYIGLFIASKTKLLENPLSAIIKKDYLQDLKPIYQDDENLDKYIASLIYQVKPERALSVVYVKYLAEALDVYDKTALSTLMKADFILDIMDEALQQVHNITHLISSMDFIDKVFTNNKIMRKRIWEDIYQKVLHDKSLPIDSRFLLSYQKKLLKHLPYPIKRHYQSFIVQQQRKN